MLLATSLPPPPPHPFRRPRIKKDKANYICSPPPSLACSTNANRSFFPDLIPCYHSSAQTDIQCAAMADAAAAAATASKDRSNRGARRSTAASKRYCSCRSRNDDDDGGSVVGGSDAEQLFPCGEEEQSAGGGEALRTALRDGRGHRSKPAPCRDRREG